MAETEVGRRGEKRPPKRRLRRRRKAIANLGVNFFIANPYQYMSQVFGVIVIISHISKIVNMSGIFWGFKQNVGVVEAAEVAEVAWFFRRRMVG